MNQTPIEIDAEIIDELVSGNLRGEHYRRVLQSFDAQPGKWRDCALAFLEDQAFARDLKLLAREEMDFTSDSRTAETEPAGSLGLHEGIEVEANVTQNQKSIARLRWMHQLTSIAAMLLISFSVGWYGSEMIGSSNGPSTQSQSDPNNTSPIDTDLGASLAENTVDSRDNLEPSGNFLGSNGRNTLSDSNGLRFVTDNMIPMKPSPPDILRKLAEQRHIDVESSGSFVPIFDGENVILVPVQRHRVVPKSISY